MSHGVPEERRDEHQTEGPPLAGGGARDVAVGADAAATVLERKAAFARQRAANFRQGAAGETKTAERLAELSAHGWVVLHDRLVTSGGNIDHILVGPGGVVVLDSKSWSGAVSVDNGQLRVAGRSRSAQVAGVAKLAGSVEQAVRGGGQDAPVHAVIVLTQEPPPNGTVRLDAGPLVAGIAEVTAVVGMLPQSVRPAQVDALLSAVLTAFPPYDRTVDEALEAEVPDRKQPSELFSRGNVFLFVEPWARSGRRRLYVNDQAGDSLGFKDLVSGDITVSVQEHADVVRGVLCNAHPGGLSLNRSALPKTPVRLPGGRLLGHLGNLWCSYLIGQHWRRAGKDRLYVTHAVMDQGIFELGHVDLATRLLHPSSEEPLAKDLREPRRYLERVAERYPRR